MRGSAAGSKSIGTFMRPKKAASSAAMRSIAWECPPRRRIGAGEVNTATIVPSRWAA